MSQPQLNNNIYNYIDAFIVILFAVSAAKNNKFSKLVILCVVSCLFIYLFFVSCRILCRVVV